MNRKGICTDAVASANAVVSNLPCSPSKETTSNFIFINSCFVKESEISKEGHKITDKGRVSCKSCNIQYDTFTNLGYT